MIATDNTLIPPQLSLQEGLHDIEVIVPKGKRRVYKPAKIKVTPRKIHFVKSPFAIKDDIKAMQGSKCNFTEANKFIDWTVKNSYRNLVQLEFLQGRNPLKWFYREPDEYQFDDSFYSHQDLIADSVATKHYQIIAGDPGVGKTLPLIRVMQWASPPKAAYLNKPIWWVGPKSSMDAIELEFDKWGFDWEDKVKMWSYDQVWRAMKKNSRLLDDPPFLLVLDEIHKLKTAETERAGGCQLLADAVRKNFWLDGFVVGLSGSPAPNNPCDWHSICEVVWPGFLAEGSFKAMHRRLRHMEKSLGLHGYFEKPGEWKLDEVDLLRTRLNGIRLTIRKEDTNLNLPAKNFVQIKIPPSKSVLRSMRALSASATSAAQLWKDLNLLSNGFLYDEKVSGKKTCPTCSGNKVIIEYEDPEDADRAYKTKELIDGDLADRLIEVEVECYHCEGLGKVDKTKRVTIEVPCPKDDALRKDLKEEENHNNGRILISDAYTGSIDRVVRVCTEEGWTVIRCDGTGFRILGIDGKPLTYWSNLDNPKVAFVIQPESGGTAFTLTEARKIVFYSNTSRPDHREQAINRLHRPGQEDEVIIKDYMHLPADFNMLKLLIKKRHLELMTLTEAVTEMFA